MSGWLRVKDLQWNSGLRKLCTRRYPGHPRGCPNFGKRDSCPPQAPLINETLDLTQPVWVIYNDFDLASHVAKMRARHPNWTERQMYCLLYWQPTARKHLRAVIEEFLQQHPGLLVVSTPEAQGVDVTSTMRGVGIYLEWPPRNVAYQVVLAGASLDG